MAIPNNNIVHTVFHLERLGGGFRFAQAPGMAYRPLRASADPAKLTRLPGRFPGAQAYDGHRFSMRRRAARASRGSSSCPQANTRPHAWLFRSE